jgi:antitoxin component of MazEF toxin-antitoxin module
VTACQWNQEEKIIVTIDESTIVISRAGLEPKYTLAELLEKCDDKSLSRMGK